MENSFLLQGLNCPNCAAKIEHEVSLLSGILSAKLNLLQQKLVITTADEAENWLETITNIVHKYEPDVAVLAAEEQLLTETFVLEGLTCPNCAAKIEHDLSALPYVQKVSLNLLNQTVTIKSYPKTKSLKAKVETIVHNYEPDVLVDVLNDSKTQSITYTEITLSKTYLIIGSILFVLGLICYYGPLNIPYLALVIFLIAYAILGLSVLKKALLNSLHASIFDENFLMSISTIGAFLLGEYPEACAVMLFYQIGEYFQNLAVNRSRKSIAALMDIRPDHANVLRNGLEISLDPKDVEVGEEIVVYPGERVPLDGQVVAGHSTLDTSALTGESWPKSVSINDEVLSGSINQSGCLTLKVKTAFNSSTVARILRLVEDAQSRKSPTENFITTFARYYTPIVVLLAILLAFIPPIFLQAEFSEWIRRGLVFLIVSCPCALVVSIPLTYFGGIGAASKLGILVKGSNFLEALSKLDACIFDKTGTLTQGRFEITKLIPAKNHTSAELLQTAAQAEARSTHPIAKSLLAQASSIDPKDLTVVAEISGLGVKAKMDDKEILVGNGSLMEEAKIQYEKIDLPGSKVYVAVNGEYLGAIIVADEPKKDAKEAILSLKQLGISKLALLTGDSFEIAKDIANRIGITSVHANLLPADKVNLVEEYEQNLSRGRKLAFVGDGINDAPVLARADVGIAMGGVGSDSAIEAADVVLMTDEPGKVADAVLVAKKTKHIVYQNIILALSVKFSFLILGALGQIGLWAAVFGDVGVTILAVINALRILSFKKDANNKLNPNFC
ncbi:MAG: cadmium-translocating P-type ATPase [Desulfovibrionaceae bacterium]|nr:cadmium-translocating P-type ATPase [Desulfovibrionaceae bacterium]